MTAPPVDGVPHGARPHDGVPYDGVPHDALPHGALPYDALLLVSFGGPEGQDDVIPYLRNVTRGRGIPDARLEEVAHHYRHFGGVSPINDQNRALKAALEAELTARGLDLPVHWGNRNWSPYLAEAVQEAHRSGHRRLLAVVTSAYSSYSSCRQYREDLAAALDETGLTGVVHIDKVRQYFDHPGFVTPFVEGVRAALGRARRALGPDAAPTDVHVLFATHSIPLSTATTSGPPGAGLGAEGAYGAQHRAVAEVVMAAASGSPDPATTRSPNPAASGSPDPATTRSPDPASTPSPHPGGTPSPHPGGTGALPWSLVYQSRSGDPRTPWLEPDINDAIRDLADTGTRAVVIVPLGFVSDHMEVMWDLDEEAMATAQEAGLWAERVATPGVHQAFVTGLVDLVTERLAPATPRPALTPLGPWFDVCPAGCCAAPRGSKPAVAGADDPAPGADDPASDAGAPVPSAG